MTTTMQDKCDDQRWADHLAELKEEHHAERLAQMEEHSEPSGIYLEGHDDIKPGRMAKPYSISDEDIPF